MSPLEKILTELRVISESDVQRLDRVWHNTYAALYQRRSKTSVQRAHEERLEAAQDAVMRHWLAEREHEDD